MSLILEKRVLFLKNASGLGGIFTGKGSFCGALSQRLKKKKLILYFVNIGERGDSVIWRTIIRPTLLYVRGRTRKSVLL